MALVKEIEPYRIVSDGSIGGTKIYDPSGNMIPRVKSVEFKLDIDGCPIGEMTLTVYGVSTEISSPGSVESPD